MLELISLEIRSCLREQEVSQTLSGETGGPQHPSQQERGGILFPRLVWVLRRTFANQPLVCFPQLEPCLQMEMEQMLIEEHALGQQKALVSGRPEDAACDQRARQRLLKFVGTPVASLQVP